MTCGVSRTTVIEAFDRLIAEGLVAARVGSGTFVSDVLNSERPQQPAPVGKARACPKAAACRKATDWAVGRFGDRLRLPLCAARLRHGPAGLRRLSDGAMGAPCGEALARQPRRRDGLRRTVRPCAAARGDRRRICAAIAASRCEAEQIFIVGGAQQAFYLIGTVLLNPGDRVWFENPGAIGARNSFLACGAELVPVPVDQRRIAGRGGAAAQPRVSGWRS